MFQFVIVREPDDPLIAHPVYRWGTNRFIGHRNVIVREPDDSSIAHRFIAAGLNPVEFDGIKMQAGLNSFMLTAQLHNHSAAGDQMSPAESVCR